MLLTILPFLAAQALVPDAAEACEPIAGWSEMLEERQPQYIVIGEMHGNAETPEIFGDAVCLTSRKSAVIVALEIGDGNQAAIDAFLASDGSSAARKALLAAPMWNQSMKDGRSSEAMLALLDRLRLFVQSGKVERVVAFVPETRSGASTQASYEAAMAARIVEAAGNAKTAMVLTGNIHAMTQPVPWSSRYLPMAGHLPEAGRVALDTTGKAGTTWACSGDPIACGPLRIGSSGEDRPRGLVMAQDKNAPYSGELVLGTATTASPPAVNGGPPILPMSETEQAAPALPPILPMRERAAVIDRILAERLETVVPQIMREQGIDMWVLMAREYFEEPVVATMLDAESMSARRRTILVFHDPGEGREVERLTVSRYGLGDLFAASWDPAEQPDQWQAVAKLVAERDPAKIAINYSDLTAFGDGMTLSQFRLMTAALPERYRNRVVSGETLALRWLESRTPAELEIYPGIVRIAHAIIAEAFSRDVITPGNTTAADVEWWYRDRLASLGLTPWFHPSIGIQRQGAEGMLRGDTVIEPGDLLWTDFGITYLRLNTDTQHLAYVLKPGETEAPAGLRAGLAATNRVQDHLLAAFETGLSGNEILARARAAAIADGLDPSIYSHPIGFHGHGAGTAVGFWDNQNGDPRSEYRLRPNTTWSIELTNYSAVPEWGGQKVDFRSEEDAYFDGETVRFLDGRQTELTLIPSD